MLALMPFWLREINAPLMHWSPLVPIPDRNPQRALTEKPGTLKDRLKSRNPSKKVIDLTDRPLHCEIRIVIWDVELEIWRDMAVVAYGPFPCQIPRGE